MADCLYNAQGMLICKPPTKNKNKHVLETFADEGPIYKMGRSKCQNITTEGTMACPIGSFLTKIAPGGGKTRITCCSPPEEVGKSEST
jgi:hypothetical protein